MTTEELFKSNDMKCTESRRAIYEILVQNGQPMTAEELFLQVRNEKEINFSTVYRTLSAFTDKKLATRSMGSDKKAYYQICGNKHNHYLVCSGCHKKIAIDGCPLEKNGADLVKQTGFQITGHSHEFVGECPECQIEGKKDLHLNQDKL